MTVATGSSRGSVLRRAAKRSLDVVGAVVGLIVLALPMALIAVAIRLTMGAPVIFRQRRPGLGGRPFRIYKFRTMSEGRDGAGAPLSDEARLSRLGRLLRRTSLDELPELINVIRGDMSLVGPRPLLMEYLDLYTPRQARRHEVRPGMTGWAQVNGRNAMTWEEKFEHDVWYVDNWSLWLDIRILMKTLAVVGGGLGVSQPGEATGEYFTGSAGAEPGDQTREGAR